MEREPKRRREILVSDKPELKFHTQRLVTAEGIRPRIQAAMAIKDYLHILDQIPFTSDQLKSIFLQFQKEGDPVLRNILFNILRIVSKHNEEIRSLFAGTKKPKVPKPPETIRKIERSERRALHEQLSPAADLIPYLQEVFTADKQLLFITHRRIILRDYDEAIALCKIVEKIIRELNITHVGIATSPSNSHHLREFLDGHDLDYKFLSNITASVSTTNNPETTRDITSIYGLLAERLHSCAQVFPYGIDPHISEIGENAFDFRIKSINTLIEDPKARVLVVSSIAGMGGFGTARNDTFEHQFSWMIYSFAKEIEALRLAQGKKPTTACVLHRWKQQIYDDVLRSGAYVLGRDIGIDPKNTLLKNLLVEPGMTYETFGDYDGLIIAEENHDDSDDERKPEKPPQPATQKPVPIDELVTV